MLIGKDSSRVHPEELMADISRSPLTGKLLVSLGIHILLVLVTSTGFIALCAKYRTLDPRSAIKREQEQQQQQAAAPGTAEGPAAQPGTQGGTAADAGESPGAGHPEPADSGGQEAAPGPSPIEQEITEVSEERPEFSTTGFDTVEELE